GGPTSTQRREGTAGQRTSTFFKRSGSSSTRGCASCGGAASGCAWGPGRTFAFRQGLCTPSRQRPRAPSRSSFGPRFALGSSSEICLRSPPIRAATPASAISLVCCAPTRTSSSTSPSFQCQSRGHWQCRSPSSDLLYPLSRQSGIPTNGEHPLHFTLNQHQPATVPTVIF